MEDKKETDQNFCVGDCTILYKTGRENKASLYTVFNAVNEKEKTESAVKIFKRDTVENYWGEIFEMMETWKGFLQENSGCIKLQKIVESRNNMYLFMPRYECTLSEFLEKGPAEEFLVPIIEEILIALKAIQNKSYVHTSLTLEHILVMKKESQYKGFLSGIKYLKKVGKSLDWRDNWLDLNEDVRGKEVKQEMNIENFGYLLKQIREKVESNKDKFPSYYPSIKDLDNFIEKCLKDYSNLDAALSDGFLKIRYENFIKGEYEITEMGGNIGKAENIKNRSEVVIVKRVPDVEKSVFEAELEILKKYYTQSRPFSRLKNYYYQWDKKCFYLIEDDIPNEITLEEFIKKRDLKNKPLEKKELQIFMRFFAESMFTMHTQGIVHSELNLRNVFIVFKKDLKAMELNLLDCRGIKFSDFGTYRSRIYGKEEDKEIFNFRDPKLTSKKDIKKIMEKEKQKIDIYSFGAIIYYLIFGKNYTKEADSTDWKQLNLLDEEKKLDILLRSCLDSIDKRTSSDLILRNSFLLSGEFVNEKYNIIQPELGSGAFARVFKCRNIDSNQEFAMKIFNTTEHDQYIKREIENLKICMDCEFIVKYEHSFDFGGRKYLIEEFLDMDLKKYIKEVKSTDRLNEKDLKVVAVSIVKALKFLHDKEILHRDIKPANILVKLKKNKEINAKWEIEKAKLGDLGFSKEMSQYSQLSVLGTAYFMAPEMDSRNYTDKVDIWSLGVTLAELYNPSTLSGSLKEMTERIASNKLAFGSPELTEVIQCCLHYNPAKRASAGQLLELAYFKEN